MYADRLEMLAEKHEYDHVMQERFDYSRWVGLDWKGMQDLSCGTRACSMGFAATMPVFQALGLSLKMFHDPFDRQYGIITLTTADDIYEREDAAAQLFGITADQARDLFIFGKWLDKGTEHEHPTALDMGKAIRNFIKYDGNFSEFYRMELGSLPKSP